MFIGIAGTIPNLPNLPGQGGGGGVEVLLEYSSSNFCADASDPTLTDASPAGGVFSYTGAGTLALNTSNGAIDISNSTSGNYIVTYTVTGVGSSNFPINITALDDASFSYSATSFCKDAPNQTPTITTPGGTFTTQDITFYPLQLQFSVTSGVEKTITIPSTTGSSFTVDWGDGTTTTETGGSISHTYNVGGSGTTSNPIVSIGAESDSGPFTSFSFNNGGSKNDLLKVLQWGSIEWASFRNTFYGCSNLDISATDTPDLTNCTDFYRAFHSCESLTGTLPGVNFNWTFNGGSLNFQQMFMRCVLFNGDISNWDIEGATDLGSMFSCYGRPRGAFNRNLNSWDTSSVTNMGSMFHSQSFNGNISNWDTSNVTNMSYMFIACNSFNQDINTKDTGTRLAWDVSSVTNFSYMFNGASVFNQDISNWKIYTGTSSVDFTGMFQSTTNFNYSINTAQVTVGSGAYQQTYLAWDTQRVSNMYLTFYNSGFNSSISNWDTSNVTNMHSTFRSSSFNQPLTAQQVTVGTGGTARTYNAWDVSLVTDMFRMFGYGSSFNQNINSWDVSSVSNISQMFLSNTVFNQNLNSWNIISLSNGSQSFGGTNSFTTANFTDTIVGWANTVYNNGGSPSTVNLSGNGKTFDGTRSGGSNFTTAQDAFDYLTTTLSWTIN